MTKIVVLFNLKPGADVAAYERWARTTDLPIVNALPSVRRFEVLKSLSLLGSAAKPPYEYVELLEVTGLEALGADIATETMARVAAEFGGFADQPQFIVTESL